MFAMQACRSNAPYERHELPQEYVLGYQEIYGHYYDSTAAVVALDLYTEGITMEKGHRIKGSGYNLYLSDIFVPDSMLESGVYHSDTTALPYTFLPGRDYEGLPHGIYLLDIQEDKIANIQVLDSGSFVYRHDSLLFTLYYRSAGGEKATYNASFSGKLHPWKK